MRDPFSEQWGKHPWRSIAFLAFTMLFPVVVHPWWFGVICFTIFCAGAYLLRRWERSE